LPLEFGKPPRLAWRGVARERRCGMGHCPHGCGEHCAPGPVENSVERGPSSTRPQMEEDRGACGGGRPCATAPRGEPLRKAPVAFKVHCRADPVESRDRGHRAARVAGRCINDGAVGNIRAGGRRVSPPPACQPRLLGSHTGRLRSALIMMTLIFLAYGVGPGAGSLFRRRTARVDPMPHDILLSVPKPSSRSLLTQDSAPAAPAAHSQWCERDSLACSVAPELWLYASGDIGLPQHGLPKGLLTLAGNHDRQYVSKWDGEFRPFSTPFDLHSFAQWLEGCPVLMKLTLGGMLAQVDLAWGWTRLLKRLD